MIPTLLARRGDHVRFAPPAQFMHRLSLFNGAGQCIRIRFSIPSGRRKKEQRGLLSRAVLFLI